MSQDERRLTILLITEDGSKDAHGTLTAVVQSMLSLVIDRYRQDQIRFEPINDPIARQAARANAWKSKNPRDNHKLVALRRYIANVLMHERGFVCFHFDGDRRWSERDSSENAAKFETQFRHQVSQLVLGELKDRGKIHELDDRMARLIALVPFYSIEAWLYQNARVAMRILRDQYSGKDVALFQNWTENPALLDEMECPKDQCCLGGRHNLELARDGFPVRAVAELGLSFAAAVASLRCAPGLVAALQSTLDESWAKTI